MIMTRSSSYPVAMIPYVNMAPFRQMGAPPNCHFVPLVPRESIKALASGNVLAAAVPVGGLPLLGNLVEPLGKFGIAAKKECMSVMFFSDRPFDRFDRNCTVHLTVQSATSVRLILVLWMRLLGKENLPEIAPSGLPANGELIIGDAAISRAAGLSDWSRGGDTAEKNRVEALSFVTDMATMWNKVSSLSFVFARWVVRRDADPKIKRVLINWLEQFRERESEMVAACVDPATRTLNINQAAAERYFQVIHRCLDDDDLLGQQSFLDEFQKVKQDLLFRHLHSIQEK